MKFTFNNKDNFFKDYDKAYVQPPKKLPLFIRLGAFISKKVVKKDLMIPVTATPKNATALSHHSNG